MIKTVEGIYQNGKVELAEQPQDIGDRVQVLVTFFDAGTTDPAKIRQLIDQLETIAGLQQGFEELSAGQTRPIAQFAQDIQQKYGISG
ncbi:MAG: hypothetical protein LH702_35495 [Phormidesmis sp. CAN_BIN44]|nr:hypothetical protein [Phormidesmis sp. CAN_BIN44]